MFWLLDHLSKKYLEVLDAKLGGGGFPSEARSVWNVAGPTDRSPCLLQFSHDRLSQCMSKGSPIATQDLRVARDISCGEYPTKDKGHDMTCKNPTRHWRLMKQQSSFGMLSTSIGYPTLSIMNFLCFPYSDSHKSGYTLLVVPPVPGPPVHHVDFRTGHLLWNHRDRLSGCQVAQVFHSGAISLISLLLSSSSSSSSEVIRFKVQIQLMRTLLAVYPFMMIFGPFGPAKAE